MIHGGLNINLKHSLGKLAYNQCCLSTSDLNEFQNNQIPWNSKYFTEIRQQNNNGEWLDACWQCNRLEKTGSKSFRQAMIEKFGTEKSLSGPQRIDLLFDRSCNLACVTCGPHSSSLWAKHLKDNGLNTTVYDDSGNVTKIIESLRSMNLENLGMIQFCGGETLLGNHYWKIAEAIADIVPDPKKIELGFQTNGTQPIDPKWFDLISRFGLVKLLVSIDGTHDRFEYLRWPGNWNQTVDNLYNLRDKLPSNVMFLIQETTSCLNLFYYNEVRDWASKNFNANREGDPTDHATQLAMHNYLNVENITQSYYDAIRGKQPGYLIRQPWKENPDNIKLLISQLDRLDQWRDLNWKKAFPEVAEFYKDYLN